LSDIALLSRNRQLSHERDRTITAAPRIIGMTPSL